MQLVNWDLLKSPYNWVTVFLMCAFALVFLALVSPQAAQE